MTTPSDKQLARMSAWPAGIDNRSPEQALTRDDQGRAVIALRDAENVDLDRQGKPSRRDGYTRVLAGQRVHSLWARDPFPFGLFVDGQDLNALREDGTSFLIRSGMGAKPVSYDLAAGRVYWSNEQQTGSVSADGVALPWGAPGPNGVPTVQGGGGIGGLSAGTYQIAVTFLTASGEESGASLAATADVPEGGGLTLTGIPQPPDASYRIRIYRSGANGDALYQAMDIPYGTTTLMLGVGRPGKLLETQFLEPMPPGHIVRAFNGRLYVACGNEVRWSEALRYGLTRLAHNRIGLQTRVSLMEPVGQGDEAGGLFVAAGERTYFWSGADPKVFGNRIAYPHGAVPGTALRVPANVFGIESTTEVVYWLASNGVGCLGLPGGTVVPLRENQAIAPSADSGASLFRDANGIQQVITTLVGAQERGLAIGDRLNCTVIRHDQ